MNPSDSVRVDLRNTTLFQEVENLFKTLRQPSTGQFNEAVEFSASPDGSHAAFSATLMDKLEGTPSTRIRSGFRGGIPSTIPLRWAPNPPKATAQVTDPLSLGKQVPPFCENQFACPSQPDLVLVAVQQSHAEFPFELTDLMADRRLNSIQITTCMAKAAELHHRFQRLDSF